MGGLEEALLRPPVLPQQDRRIAGQGVEKAPLLGKEVAIMQHFPLCKAISREFLQKELEFCQEKKRGGPLEVLMLRRVDQLLGVGGGEAVLETGEHGSKLFLAEFQLFLAYVKNGKFCVVNNTYEPQSTTVFRGDGSSFQLDLAANEGSPERYTARPEPNSLAASWTSLSRWTSTWAPSRA